MRWDDGEERREEMAERKVGTIGRIDRKMIG
jgi:hypothetical protein